MVNRFAMEDGSRKMEVGVKNPPIVLLLPGSRRGELQKHLPPMLGALKLIQEKLPAAKAKMVLPDESLAKTVSLELKFAKKIESLFGLQEIFPNLEIQIGDLPKALAEADVAIASTGTVTMECAFFGLPTVTLYILSWLNYQIGIRILTSKWLTMPNILADEVVYPEFLQYEATPENLSRAALELLQDESRRKKIKSQLASIVASLGEPGAANRAATAVLNLFNNS
jgi:lipid-A-disaccharide synthase